MFYSKEILTSKKGGFGVIWLAATLGSKSNLKKLTKKEVNGVDVVKACEYLTHPPEPLALRLTSNLMVGVARVYNQQYQFYYIDVNNVWVKLKRELATMQFEDIDMPVAEARPDAITMMEEDPEFEIDMVTEANRNVNVPVRDAVVPETDFGWLIRLPETERGSASESAVPSITPPENRRASDPTLLSNADERLSFHGTNSPLGGPSSVFGSLGSLDGVGRLAQMEDVLLGGVGDEEGPTFFFDEEGNLHESQPSTARPSSVKPRTGVEYDEHDLLVDVMDDHAGVARGTMKDKGKEKATDRNLHDDTDREPSLHLMDHDEEQAQAVPIYRGPMPMEDVKQEGQSAAFLVVATPRPKRKEARRLRGKYPLWDEVTELPREELIESKENILRVYERDRKEAERKARIREGKRYAENLLFESNLPIYAPELKAFWNEHVVPKKRNLDKDKRKISKRPRTAQQEPAVVPDQEITVAVGADIMQDDLLLGTEDEGAYDRSLREQSSTIFGDVELARRAGDGATGSQSMDSFGRTRGLIWNQMAFGPVTEAEGSVTGVQTASHDGMSTGRISSFDTPNVRRRSLLAPRSTSPFGRLTDEDMIGLDVLTEPGDEADGMQLPFSEDYIRMATMEGDTANFVRYVQSKIIDSLTLSITFEALVPHQTEATRRLTAATAFYNVLVLASRGIVQPKQEEPYGDIEISMPRPTNPASRLSSDI